jgi:ABC-type transporter Mla MlaB component|tara:strand:+ start:2621 stop:2920 length:300 start_codon:yes stop_codon:yes gene_type:complete
MNELQSLGAGTFRVTSDLTTETVPDLWAQSKKLFPSTEASSINIDVSNVVQVDSGGLALLVAWARWANFRDKKFALHGKSDQLAVLIENNQLEKLFYSA